MPPINDIPIKITPKEMGWVVLSMAEKKKKCANINIILIIRV